MVDGGIAGLGVLVMIVLFYVAPIVLIIFAIRWAVSSGVQDAATKTGTTPGETPSGQKAARQILDERYARGEIERGEYEQMRRDIED